MTLQFRMYTDENDYFLRDYQVPAETTLSTFHTFICTDLDYQPRTNAVYYTVDEEGYRQKEIYNTHTGKGGTASLQEFISGSGNRFLFLFDVENDRFFYLDLTAVIQEDAVASVIFSNGDAPGQTHDYSDEKGSIFDDAMEDFGDFGEEDTYPEE